ncbi:retrotransposon protein, putative, ty1-copia subclass [Tanacetum coccineum]
MFVREENRTLLDMVRSMMSQTTLPKTFWDYALETAARILNIVPTKKVEKTPYEVWHGQASKLSYLKVWGCEALVKRDTLTKPDKLEPRYIKCIFVGYPKETMGYSFYYPPENKVLVARNGLITQEASGSLEDLKIIQEEDTHPSIDTSLHHEEDNIEIDEPQSDIIPIRRCFAMKYLGEAAYIHGIKIYRDRSRRLIGASTPAELKRMQNAPYASAVSCYTDAGYLTDADDLKSQTEYVFILNGGVVDWKSVKQIIFATSSAEAELGVVPTVEEPINMYCDNTGAITIANESGITKGARHFCAKVHYLREVIEFG